MSGAISGMAHKPPHVLFIAANARSLVANRGDLIREMRRAGYRVSAAVPIEDYREDVECLDIDIYKFKLGRTALNPLRDVCTMLWLYRFMLRLKVDVVFAYGAKPVIYGILAARAAGISSRFAMITGLGTVFIGSETGARGIIRKIVVALYSAALASTKRVFFQNPDDIREFVRIGALRDVGKAVRTMGSGVSLEHFKRVPLPAGKVTFLFLGRLLREKGISEFCEAARLVRGQWPDARFFVLGPYDASLPHAVSVIDLAKWRAEGNVEFLGEAIDVRPYLASCSVFVLPSYREGTPRSALEAMATGRPVITTDVPGCREVVRDGENGFLVPPKNVPALAAAMLHFRENRNLLVEMGELSYRRAVSDYDVRLVNKAILEAMELV